MIGKVFDRMNALRPVATKTEVKIIDGIKKIDKNTLIYLSITELSGIVDVAEATILRFCRKLDYKGFQDFKLNLSQELGSVEEGAEGCAKRIADEMADAVLQTYKQIDYEKCKAVAHDIVQARKVCAFAVGASTIATKALQLSLLRLGLFVDASTDNHVQSIAAANLDGRDFLILFSVSGSTKDIVNLAEIAKKNGTKILVVTNYNKSPLAKYADYLLLSVRKEAAQNGGALSTSVAQEYIADVLCSAVCEVLENEGAVNRFKSSAAVADKAY